MVICSDILERKLITEEEFIKRLLDGGRDFSKLELENLNLSITKIQQYLKKQKRERDLKKIL